MKIQYQKMKWTFSLENIFSMQTFTCKNSMLRFGINTNTVLLGLPNENSPTFFSTITSWKLPEQNLLGCINILLFVGTCSESSGSWFHVFLLMCFLGKLYFPEIINVFLLALWQCLTYRHFVKIQDDLSPCLPILLWKRWYGNRSVCSSFLLKSYTTYK